MTYITKTSGWACDNRCSEKWLTHQQVLTINQKFAYIKNKKKNAWLISDSNVIIAERIFTKYRDTERKFFRSFYKFNYFISEPRFDFVKSQFSSSSIFLRLIPLVTHLTFYGELQTSRGEESKWRKHLDKSNMIKVLFDWHQYWLLEKMICLVFQTKCKHFKLNLRTTALLNKRLSCDNVCACWKRR